MAPRPAGQAHGDGESLGMDYEVKTVLLTDIFASISQDRLDLPLQQRRELALDVGQ